MIPLATTPVGAVQPATSAGAAAPGLTGAGFAGTNPAGAGLVDAFQSALRAAGEALGANPGAVGRVLLNGVDDFRLRETHVRDAAASLSGADGIAAAKAPSSLAAAPSHSVSGLAPSSAVGSSAATPPDPAVLRDGGMKAMSVMMETYDFALQTSLVTNAATTFTSSVNTLIKTQ